MISGHFYFIKDEFYDNLPDCGLMANKGYTIGENGGRPCHYCFIYDEFYWMIPVSSKISKYHRIYEEKVEKRGYCDTIRFGFINGKERAFLIQNCFPVTEEYIDEEYTIDKGKVVVTVHDSLSNELNKLVKKVIRLNKKGIRIVMTDIDKIIDYLEK